MYKERDMKKLVEKYEEFFAEFCKFRGLDPDNDHLKETPHRVVKALLEATSGYEMEVKSVLGKRFKKLDDDTSSETFILSDGILVVHNAIPFTSLCAHHLYPFFGFMYIGMLLRGEIIGLSKVTRVVDIFSKRLQVQEELTSRVATSLTKYVESCRGVIVVSDAIHGCMSFRGVRKNSVTTCSAITGVFAENDKGIKQEFFHLIKRQDLSLVRL
jgi:GTP cyclohydrolase I